MATDSTLRNTGNCSPQALIWNVLEHLSQTYPVIQWLRIHLPMRGAWVRSLVWEDSTYHGATKPMHHDYRAHALSRSPRSVTREATAVRSPGPQLERAHTR